MVSRFQSCSWKVVVLVRKFQLFHEIKFLGGDGKPEKMFTLKKWNAVAMWSWDVECDVCAICRVQVMGELSFLLFTNNNKTLAGQGHSSKSL